MTPWQSAGALRAAGIDVPHHVDDARLVRYG